MYNYFILKIGFNNQIKKNVKYSYLYYIYINELII